MQVYILLESINYVTLCWISAAHDYLRPRGQMVLNDFYMVLFAADNLDFKQTICFI